MTPIDSMVCTHRTDHYEVHLAADGTEALSLHRSDVPESQYATLTAHVGALGFTHVEEFGHLAIPYTGEDCGLWGELDYEIHTLVHDEVAALEEAWTADSRQTVTPLDCPALTSLAWE